MSQISQNHCLYNHRCRCHSSAPSLPQPPLFLNNQITWFAIFLWLMWCLFPPIGTCFIACKHLPLADTFVTKSRFYHFFLHQTQSKHDGNVREKAWWTSFTVSPVLDVPVRPSTREVGRGVGLAASYTWTSTDSNSTLLSSRIWISSDPNGLFPDSFSLINPQQSF